MPSINKYTDLYHPSEYDLIKEIIMSNRYGITDLIGDLNHLRLISTGWGVNCKRPYNFDGLAVPDRHHHELVAVERNYVRLLRPLLQGNEVDVAVFLHRAGINYEILPASGGGKYLMLYINHGCLVVF